ncbi:MAG TPA: alpha/beta fold hydrolase [Candidatus Saccharimonadales bacterium]|nr:alpha/beta fold hydrolase [Candidatus Saccharimonadales bacterium]
MRFLRALAIIPLLCLAALAQDGHQQYADLGTCKLESGKVILDCRIGYRVFGHPAPDGSNVVLVPTWFTGTTEGLARWTIGPSRTFDPSQWAVIAVDALGNGVSSSPSNSPRQPRMQFPQFTMRDLVETQYRLLTETLHFRHIHAVSAVSMGGMQTFQWAFSHPEFIDTAVPIVGTPRPTAFDLLLCRAEMNGIMQDRQWNEGNYEGHPNFRTATDIHTLLLTTPINLIKNTSSASALDVIQKAEADDTFDGNDRIRQLQAMMGQDVAQGKTLAEAAKSLKVRMAVIVSQQDHMVNPTSGIEFAKAAGAPLLVLTGDCGHLATGCEGDTLKSFVESALKGDQK